LEARGRVKAARGRAILFLVCGQALRSLLRNSGRSALSAFGIAIGVAAVVLVVGIGRAGTEKAEVLLRELGDNLVWVEAGSRNVAGVRTGSHGTQSLMLDDAEAILREIPAITRMSPQIDGTVLAISSYANWTTRSRGVAPDYLSIKRWTVAMGQAFSDDDVERARNVCLIGATARARLFGNEPALGEVVRIGGQPFTVLGILGAKGQSSSGVDQDDVLFVPYTTAQQKLRTPRAAWVDDIVCSAAAPELVAPAAERVIELVRQRHHIAPGMDDDFNIRHPEEVIKAQLEASTTLANLLLAIAAVSLVVGGVGVMNVMLATVTERTREIGVRLALGATDGAILLQFLAEALFLCLAGAAFGIALSLVGSAGFEAMLGWSLSLSMPALGAGITFSIVTGVVFGLLPAHRAARLDPLEALRSE
jgi:putative ABC transport system permease protein